MKFSLHLLCYGNIVRSFQPDVSIAATTINLTTYGYEKNKKLIRVTYGIVSATNLHLILNVFFFSTLLGAFQFFFLFLQCVTFWLRGFLKKSLSESKWGERVVGWIKYISEWTPCIGDFSPWIFNSRNPLPPSPSTTLPPSIVCSSSWRKSGIQQIYSLTPLPLDLQAVIYLFIDLVFWNGSSQKNESAHVFLSNKFWEVEMHTGEDEQEKGWLAENTLLFFLSLPVL